MFNQFIAITTRVFSVIGNSLRNSNLFKNSKKGEHVKLYSKFTIINSIINNYSYISANSNIRNTEIGKFCSIGPNFMCGLAIHPIDGISTSPFFYSTKKQCGVTISEVNKIKEFGEVKIGNDVFIGANVTISTNLTIGNGVVIAAGSVVVKDIPDYAIVGGVPAKIIKYRYSEEIIEQLLKLEWWNFSSDKLHHVEKNFFNIDEFLKSSKLL